MQIGYCGNVHPAVTIDQVLDNVQRHASAVRNLCCPDETLPFGIWVSKTALDQLQSKDNILRLCDAMQQHHVNAFTINGFPFGDFHQTVVKHSVYQPDWSTDQRLDYTLKLASLHDALLPSGKPSTISTLPLGWPQKHGKPTPYHEKRLRLHEKADATFLKACAEQLRLCAVYLSNLEFKTGRHCMICIEPEPGCVLDTAADVCEFFNEYLFAASDAITIQSHIGVCHDVCHSAVMFEDQADAINTYADSGIAIGKVQVSSAVEVDFENFDDLQKVESFQTLSEFSEPKYLHQTCVSLEDEVFFYQDLAQAINAHSNPEGVWRVHFHVPIFASSLGNVGTTQVAINECIQALDRRAATEDSLKFAYPQHFEVETYAWNVLPVAHRGRALTTDIAAEISWFKSLVQSR
jgi:hypothetical protein